MALFGLALATARFAAWPRRTPQLAGSFYKRHAVTAQRLLRLLVGARFQVLFHSPLGVLFTFPSRYWFAIGHRRVFSLGGWSPRLRTGFHVPGPTRDTRQRSAWFRVRGSHPLRPALPCRSATMWICNRSQVGSTWTRVPQPPGGNACRLHAPGFGLVRFRSPLLAQSRLISLPRGT